MIPCPICASPAAEAGYVVRGHTYHRCLGCGGEFLDPAAATGPGGAAYQGAYLDRGEGAGGLSGYYDYEAEEALHRRNFQQNLDILKDFGAGPRLLDVGCASGHFLGAARARGYEIAGLDRGEAAIEAVRARLGCPAWAGDVQDVDPGRAFDTITLWETLEHIPDPAPALSRLKARLAPGGLIAIGTGDNKSPLARLLGARWWYRTPPDHCVIYNAQALRAVLARAGLTPVGLRRIPYHWVGAPNVAMKLLRSFGASPALGLKVAGGMPPLPLPILHGITLVILAR